MLPLHWIPTELWLLHSCNCNCNYNCLCNRDGDEDASGEHTRPLAMNFARLTPSCHWMLHLGIGPAAIWAPGGPHVCTFRYHFPFSAAPRIEVHLRKLKMKRKKDSNTCKITEEKKLAANYFICKSCMGLVRSHEFPPETLWVCEMGLSSRAIPDAWGFRP